jgi:uncharacterized protein
MPSVERIIEILQLKAHPEGGFFSETFRAQPLPFALPERGARAASTAIYFLLRAHDFSALHLVSSDEVWHHYAGDALELHCFDRERRHRRIVLGDDLLAGQRPQHVVEHGELQGARVMAGPHGFALCGCTVAPGFDFADFRMPARAELLGLLPEHARLVNELTRA